MEKKLELILSELSNLKQTMATKEDLERFATKDDLDELRNNMATKDDLEKFATKDDLEGFATKKDLERLATKEDVADLPAVKVAVVEMSNVVNQIKQTLDHQGKILETLSMKYIEHETEIRELKRIK